MRLVTFREQQGTSDQVGALVGDASVLVLEDCFGDAGRPSMLALIEGGDASLEQARDQLARQNGCSLPLADVTLRAPIPLPPQYRDAMCFFKHIRQSGAASARMLADRLHNPADRAAAEAAAAATDVPDIYRQQPFYYKGNRFAVGHPDSPVVWPAYSNVMDFELELACVIGRGGKDIAKASAHEHVFGYMILNDFSARDAQGPEMMARLGPAKGKDFDGANVFGPCLVTADEIGDPYDLKMRAWVNGEQWTDGWSGDMHFRFDDLIQHISAGETLYPGEIIGSGTVGDGCGLEHLRFLNDGDVVELEIERIGRLTNRVVRTQQENAR